MSLVQGIYKGKYWDSCRCDELPNLWRYPVFSCSVNCGSKIAVQILQKCVYVDTDGDGEPDDWRQLEKDPDTGVVTPEKEQEDSFIEFSAEVIDWVEEYNVNYDVQN